MQKINLKRTERGRIQVAVCLLGFFGAADARPEHLSTLGGAQSPGNVLGH